MTVDYPDWRGTPLVQGANILAGPAQVVNLAAGGAQSFSFLVSKPGYVISLKCATTGVPGVPFVQVDLNWQDPNRTVIMDFQTWILPAATVGNYLCRGTGPARGESLTVTFTNLDPGTACTVTWSLLETTQHVARDDWRAPLGRGAITVPGFTLANSNISSGLLQSIPPTAGNTIPANTTLNYLLPTYCGPVWLNTIAAANIGVSVRVVNNLAAIPYGGQGDNGIGSPIWQDLTLTAILLQFTMPRVPLILGMQNSTGAAIAIQQAMYITENAS